MSDSHSITDQSGLEVWADIPNYEGSYQVSTFGRIKSLPRWVLDSRLGWRYVKEIIRKQGNGPKNTCIVTLNVLSGRHTFAVHRLVAETFIPNPENKPQVNHKDGSRLNNHVSNLEWVTCSENHLHAFATGLKCHKGSKHPRSELREEDIPIIRQRLSNGDKGSDIAKDFHVCKQLITHIKHGRRWNHVP